jgi:radical SAM protein with 4Fe4S-binding SPASM domain
MKNDLPEVPLQLLKKLYKTLGIKGISPEQTTVQIELAGLCSANCEFCDWTRRPKEQKIFMDTELAKKCVREAKELKVSQISFHVTGEPLDHPDILDIIPHDYPIVISTNCLSLENSLARELSHMDNLLIILAVLWSEPKERRERSIANAKAYLDLNPNNRNIFLQMICSEHAVQYSSLMYETFSPYLKQLPGLQLHYKQPYTQEPERPTLGYIPANIPMKRDRRVQIDYMPTPQSCGPDCLAFAPNPSTDIIIQSDGQIKPCFKRWPYWNLGNIKDTTLAEVKMSKRLKEIRDIWCTGDPDNKLACHDCIRMAVPRGEPVWWSAEASGKPPSKLNRDQIMRSGDTIPSSEKYRLAK